MNFIFLCNHTPYATYATNYYIYFPHEKWIVAKEHIPVKTCFLNLKISFLNLIFYIKIQYEYIIILKIQKIYF